MNTTRRPTWLALIILLTLMLAACGQGATPATTGNASSAPSAVASTSSSPPTSAAVAPSAEPAAPSPTAPPTPAVAATSSAPAPASGSALDAISAAYKASVAAKSYHVESTITSGGTTTIASTFDIMRPDRLHRTTTIHGKTSESIIIDATTYARANGGEWVKSTDSTGALDILQQIGADSATIDQLTKQITDAKVIGPDTLDGKPMMVYQYALTFKVNDAGAESSSITKMWVGNDSLPYKLESDGSTNITGKTTTSHTVNIYSDYNTDFKIVAPIP